MIVWVDAQLSPALAPWLTKELPCGVTTITVITMTTEGLGAAVGWAGVVGRLARRSPPFARAIAPSETACSIEGLPSVGWADDRPGDGAC